MRLLLGRSLLAMQRYAEVLSEMRVLLGRAPGNGPGLALQGEALLYKGEAAKAVQVLREAHAAAPHDPAIRALREQAERAAALEARSFGDEDAGASAAATRHYRPAPGAPPSVPRRGQAPAGAPERPAPPASPAQSASPASLAKPSGRAPAATSSPPAGAPKKLPPPAPGARGGAPAATPAARPVKSAARPAPSLQPEQSGSFEEPTAIYDPGAGMSGQVSPSGSRAVGSPGPPRATSPTRGPSLGAISFMNPASGPDDADADELDEDAASTHLMDVDATLRSRPDTSTVPAARRFSTEAPTNEAPPPVLPRVTLPAVAVPPAPPARSALPLPGVAAAQGPARSSEAPMTRAAAAEARRAPVLQVVSAPTPGRPARPARVLTPVPPPGGRPASAALYDPTVAVARQARRRSRSWHYLLVALVVIAGGAIGGLQIRKLRLDWEIDGARREAEALMAQDTYAGYARARDVYADIAAVRVSPGDQASLARAQAALAAEFDDGYGEAQSAVRALTDTGAADADATLARAYLALAERDATGALAQAEALAGQASEDPFAPYLQGRVRLLTGDLQGALTAFQQAAERTPRPLFLIWQGHAHRALGQRAEAEAAFARVLEQVPDHPAAVLGRAELATSTAAPAPEGLEAALAALIAEGARPLAEQTAGVSSGQMARAGQALVMLRIQRGDQPGARQALDQLQTMRREGDPDFAVNLALAQALLGETDAALAELARTVDAWPTRLDARLAWAELALRLGDVDTARKALIGVDGMDVTIAGNARALAVRGRIQLALGALEPALADLDAALKLQPALPDAVVTRAEIDLVRGDPTRAVERLAPLAGESAPAEMRLLYAAALRGSGERAQARAVLEALRKEPNPPPRTFLELARLERDQGRWTEARSAYAEAVERMEGTEAGIEARIEAARLALDTGDRAGARQAIAALADGAASKNDGRVLVEAARIYTLGGAHQEAAAYLGRAGALSSPPQAHIARERGRLALRKGDLPAAIQALEMARASLGNDAETLLLLVEAHLVQRNGEAAAAVHQDHAKRPGMDAAALALAEGLIAAAGNRVDAALAAYKKARNLLTERKAAPRQIAYVDYLTGRTLFEDDRLSEARKALEQAIGRDPGHADPYFVLGMVAYGGRRHDDAAKAFQAALARDAASLPEAWFYLGEVEMERKRAADAQKAFRAYLELSPTGAKAEDAKRYLSGLGK